MIGIAIIQAFSAMDFPHIIGKIGAFLVIILGLIDVKDYFQHGKPILSMSSSQWITVRTYFHKCTVPASFIAGFSAGLFEFPCTGGIYVVILEMLAYKRTFMQGLTYLLIYNITFILPLISIILLSSRKRVISFSIEKWQQHRGKCLRLLSGLVMIGIGLLLLSFRLV